MSSFVGIALGPIPSETPQARSPIGSRLTEGHEACQDWHVMLIPASGTHATANLKSNPLRDLTGALRLAAAGLWKCTALSLACSRVILACGLLQDAQLFQEDYEFPGRYDLKSTFPGMHAAVEHFPELSRAVCQYFDFALKPLMGPASRV